MTNDELPPLPQTAARDSQARGGAPIKSDWPQYTADQMRAYARAALAAAAPAGEPAAVIERLRHAGNMLSNCAFNLAQSVTLDDRARKAFDKCRREWDAARSEQLRALAAPAGEPDAWRIDWPDVPGYVTTDRTDYETAVQQGWKLEPLYLCAAAPAGEPPDETDRDDVQQSEPDDDPPPAWPDEAALRDALDMLNSYAEVIRSCRASELERFDYLPRVEEVIEALGVYAPAPAGGPLPMKTWQHDETGRICLLERSPGPRWTEVPPASQASCWYCGAEGEECQKPFADVPCRRGTAEPTASAPQRPE